MKYEKGTFIIYNDMGIEFGRISSERNNDHWATVYNPLSRQYTTVFDSEVYHTYPANLFRTAKDALMWWQTCNRLSKCHVRSKIVQRSSNSFSSRVELVNVPGYDGTILLSPNIKEC